MMGIQAQLRSILTAMITIPLVVVIFRFWSRAVMPKTMASKIPKRFWWDDWTALAAALINIAFGVIALKLVDLGLGQHIHTINPNQIEPFLKLLWVEFFAYDIGVTIAKSSALFFYARVFGVVHTWFKYSLWTMHAINVIWLIGAFFSVIFECRPIYKAWYPHMPGECVDPVVFYSRTGIPSMIIDIIILLLPLPILWNLHLQMVRKLQLVFVFLLGYCVVVVSIGRRIAVTEAGSTLRKDPTFALARPSLWLACEIAICITSTSLPSLFYFARRAYHNGPASLLNNRSHQAASRIEDTYGSKSHHLSRDDPAKMPLSSLSLESLHKFPESSNSNAHIMELRRIEQSSNQYLVASPQRAHYRNEFQ